MWDIYGEACLREKMFIYASIVDFPQQELVEITVQSAETH